MPNALTSLSQGFGSPTNLTKIALYMNTEADELNSTYLAADTMQAIGLTAKPEISMVSERLDMLDVTTPRPGASEVAIQLCASAMHIDEIYAAQGTSLGRFFGPQKVSTDNPYVLGSSASGVVVDIGEKVNKFKIGDEVIVIPNETGEFGSWADYRCVAQDRVMSKPESLSHIEAAALCMASCVAWSAISFTRAREGDRCVVVGATGSIGVMILQLLKVRGCHVTAVCSTTSEAFARTHGADEVIDYTKHEFGASLREKGALQDSVFDCIGGRDTEANAFQALKPTGVFATVVGPTRYIGERKLSWWKFGKLMSYIGYRMLITRLKGPRYVFAAKYPRLVINDAMTQVVKNDIRMPVQQIIPFELSSIKNAVKLLLTHRAKGRIVIDFSHNQPR